MKQKISPSPTALLIFSCFLVVAGIVVGLDVYTGGTPSDEEFFGTAVAVFGFLYFLVRFIFGKRVEFDFDGFTVKGHTYRFSDISEAQVVHKRVFIPGKRIRFCIVTTVKIYVRDKCVTSFTEDDLGYKELVALLKKHRVKFNIKNSLSSWKGEIE